jgi:hypothetical protein
MADWEEALEADHQRQAKLIVMQAIYAAERRGRRQGWQMLLEAAEKHGILLVNIPYPEDAKE